MSISYSIAGEAALDYELALTKLKELFGIETLMLGGDAELNWSFIQAGMCDEVSVVIAAAADGSPTTQTLFMAREGLSDDTPIGFALQEAKVMDGGSVWLRYLIKKRYWRFRKDGINMSKENLSVFPIGEKNEAYAAIIFWM